LMGHFCARPGAGKENVSGTCDDVCSWHPA
jgi:hypothetical protein